MIARKRIILIFFSIVLWYYFTQYISSAGDAPKGMVLIPAGEFEMGSDKGAPNERPVHTVYLDTFYMDTHEVTNAQYKAFINANPEWQKENIPSGFHDGVYLRLWDGNTYPEGEADHPVVYVSWYAAMAYAEWRGKRLPTEAEWEKAARGGLTGKAYPWGDTVDETRANYTRYHNAPIAVGQYPPNAYGLYDMAGNISEWCLDEYDPDFYATSARENPFSNGSIKATLNNFRDVKQKDRVYVAAAGAIMGCSCGLLTGTGGHSTTPASSADSDV